LKHQSQRIPTHDYLGRKVWIGEKATIFSPAGIHYEGTIQQIGGKRWFVVDDMMKIGGIGNCFMMKD
jgi:hypothetical protein